MTSGGTGPTVSAVSAMAGMAGMEFLVIGKETKLAQFKNELKWNDLYYLLARGI